MKRSGSMTFKQRAVSSRILFGSSEAVSGERAGCKRVDICFVDSGTQTVKQRRHMLSKKIKC